MPVVGRDDNDGVDLAIVEDAAKVAEGFRLVPAHFLDLGDRLIGMIAIDIADGGDAGVGVPEELAKPRHALAADADHPEHDLIVRSGWDLRCGLP